MLRDFHKSRKNPLLTGSTCFNSINNLFSHELGLVSSNLFIASSNTRLLEEIRLSKYRSIRPVDHSITWLSLDNVENRFLLAAKSNGTVTCFDMMGKKSEKAHVLSSVFDSSDQPGSHTYSCSCVQWYPMDSGMFFTSGMDQKLKVWDTNSLQVVDEYNIKHKIYQHNISQVACCNNRTLVAMALDNGQVRFVDINTGAFTHTLKAHPQGYCVCVQWSPSDSNILASGGSDGRIALWDIRAAKACIFYLDYEKTVSSKKSKQTERSIGKTLAHNGPIVGLTYTPDGHQIISLAKDNRLQLWNASNGLNTITNYGKVPLNSAVAEASLQISCTDNCLEKYVFVPSNSNLLMYNVHEGSLKKIFKGHFEAVNCCVYSSGLNEVYSGSKDRNVLIWTPEKQVNIEKVSIEKSGYSMMSRTGRNEENVGVKRSRDNWSDDDDY